MQVDGGMFLGVRGLFAKMWLSVSVLARRKAIDLSAFKTLEDLPCLTLLTWILYKPIEDLGEYKERSPIDFGNSYQLCKR